LALTRNWPIVLFDLGALDRAVRQECHAGRAAESVCARRRPPPRGWREGGGGLRPPAFAGFALFAHPLALLHQGPLFGRWASAVRWRAADVADAAMWIDGDAHVTGLVSPSSSKVAPSLVEEFLKFRLCSRPKPLIFCQRLSLIHKHVQFFFVQRRVCGGQN
jgi:hypothetical protein